MGSNNIKRIERNLLFFVFVFGRHHKELYIKRFFNIFSWSCIDDYVFHILIFMIMFLRFNHLCDHRCIPIIGLSCQNFNLLRTLNICIYLGIKSPQLIMIIMLLCYGCIVLFECIILEPFLAGRNIEGWIFFKVYHTRQKGSSPYYNLFLPYILIPIKNNESKIVKIFKRIIF
jgi:hypothetical protein